MKIMGLTNVKLQMMNTCLTSSDSEKDTSRIENILWSSCGKYKPMATHTESICYLDKYENCKSYFKGVFIRF